MSIAVTKNQPTKINLARAFLTFEDGKTSTMDLSFPQMSYSVESIELAKNNLEDFICQLSGDLVNLSSYQISCGSIKPDGTFNEIMIYDNKVIKTKSVISVCDMFWNGEYFVEA